MSEEAKARVRRVARHQSAGRAKEFDKELSDIIDVSVKNVSGKIKSILRDRFPEKVSS